MLGKPLLHWRRVAGALLREWPHYRRVLATPGDGYIGLHNRRERLEPAPGDAPGFRCCWQWTSDLHAPRMLPGLGLRLMRRALADHPVGQSAVREQGGAPPDIAFLIGHRGEARLPHLLATLASIGAQEGAAVECIVVEQDAEPRARAHLPAWVRHVHAPPPRPDMPYSRSWAFNLGMRHARAGCVVLHDNDMLVPTDYAACVLRHVHDGHELVNLKRFVFYLDAAHTRAVLQGGGITASAPEAVTQNLEGGGSVAITREAYARIGGMDESFIGWGGEDNEFWQRAQTLSVWPYAYLPIVHLWHAPQPGKQALDNPTLARLQALSLVPVAERIARLRDTPAGHAGGPAGWAGGTG